jgi:hypothetical protein
MSMQQEELTDARHQDMVEDEDTPEDQLLTLRCQQHAAATPHLSKPFNTTDHLTTSAIY